MAAAAFSVHSAAHKLLLESFQRLVTQNKQLSYFSCSAAWKSHKKSDYLILDFGSIFALPFKGFKGILSYSLQTANLDCSNSVMESLVESVITGNLRLIC